MAMSDYAGDLSPQEAWSLLESDPSTVLVDVRTQAEWAYVGVADLSSLNKNSLFIEWVSYPDGRINPEFPAQLEANNIERDAPILFLCRSGVRSIAAATLMTGNGYSRCYNITEGFEGGPDGDRHRGSISGWKVRGLPWAQQ
jgi:rhodanese-related sulfurtransferase